MVRIKWQLNYIFEATVLPLHFRPRKAPESSDVNSDSLWSLTPALSKQTNDLFSFVVYLDLSFASLCLQSLM